MDLLELNKFMVLLWKNFILKKRHIVAVVVEIILTLLFAGVILFTRRIMDLQKIGPFRYPPQRVDELPAFLKRVPSFGLWELAFVPSKSVVVKNIVETVKKNLNYNFKVQGFSSERDFEAYVRRKNNSERVIAAFVFDHEFQNSHDPLPLKVKYYLRFSNFQRSGNVDYLRPGSWETDALFPRSPTIGPRNAYDPSGGSPGYITEGFLLMQHTLDKAIMEYHNPIAARVLFSNVQVFVQRFPYPIYYHDYFYNFFGIFLPLVILFIFIVNHLTLIQSIVWEKENQLKEYQLMIGLSTWMLWAAYFLTFLTLYSITIFFMCLIFFAKMEPVPIIQYSDPSVIFVFLLCFAIATIFFTFMVSTLFNKAHFAVSVGGFIYFATYFPANSVATNYNRMTLAQKLASSLSSNILMELGTKFLVRAEIDKIGLKWSNIFSPVTVENFVFVYVLGMFLFDAVLYGLVAWYIEAVFPGEYGVRKPWNFFLLRSHWCGEKPRTKDETQPFYKTVENKYFEAEPTDLVAGIQIQHLYKEFQVHNTTKVAVEDLSLNLYEGQITVLLGHNGAGKSTTLSILSGLYPASSGEAYVNGYAISKHMDQVRKSLGLCPQHDLLFSYLTVSEHLHFYCGLKGVPQKMHRIEADRMLSTFNLLEKRNAFSKSLSGGMKRKLSIIIALIGDSKVVILDEPTAGMDPASRRDTWDLLQQCKQDRTILLTTHYMDEADTLGDRIAIMVKGSLRCCGSSLFLKKIYGVGYHITMVKEPHCNVEEISKLICHHISSATLEKNVSNELSFVLPKEYTHSFEALFTDLEKRQKELGIASFGASVTTLEEVFFRVSNMEDAQTNILPVQPQPLSPISEVSVENQNTNMSRNAGADSYTVNESPDITFNTGCTLYRQQLRAMFLKRVIFNWRNWKLLLLQILALTGSLALLSRTDWLLFSYSEHARQMNLSEYGQTIVPVSVSGNANVTQVFLKSLKSMLESDSHTIKEVEDDPYFGKTNQYRVVILGGLQQYFVKAEECIHFCIVAFSLEVNKGEIILTGLFNNQAYHSPALTLAILDNILFMLISGPNASLTVSNKPQLPSANKKVRERFPVEQAVALNIHFGMAFLVSGFCLLTVTERISKAKHIQFVSGVCVLVYWLSALLWDLAIFFVACCLLLGVFKICNFNVYLTDYHFLDTMLVFMLYGWSAVPLMYLLSFLFSKSSSAYIKLVMFNYLSGILSLLMDAVYEAERKLSNTTRTFTQRSLLLLPNYNLAKCISNYYAFYLVKPRCLVRETAEDLHCAKKNTTRIYSLEDKMIGKYLIMMGTIGLLCLLLIFFRETAWWKLRSFLNQYIYFRLYKMFNKGKLSKELSGEHEDEDVGNERKRILGHPQEMMSSAILIKTLTKIYFKYPVILAVKNISVAIQKGECFGLLGFNGAGKTSTFQILTGEETATTGHVFIDGICITKNIQRVKSRIGYCPQSDALLEYLTGREIMIMYARLWGVSEPQIQLYVSKWLNSLQLESHADRIIKTYSGGNKRRLSTAIALMGNPAVILLDEPTTGMDPVARRLLWDAVMQERESGKAIIITSHRMEECDAYCTRLAIMVQGKFMCLGSPQHLKNKYGNSYIVKIKAKADTEEHKLNDFKNFFTITFPGSELKQENHGTLSYYIPSKDNSWAKVFGILEEAKEQFDLEDYSVSQITLEQVFLTFANAENKGLDDYKEVL